ncbi:type 4a pilus biogenesis protein PilO [Thiohalocapsa marina]|uniref:Type 4a pilus biogenesis protein PilO n=1 Tax=Thiohalocapsa marina TaxID=424902 RepID=A0A5M8FLB0_9GAMM|nr:type 4a pilus biogenesis protein PilO [Thiohalocapsa marina]KAA6185517.1 type 4a pilus biogenesis protein PilO [Thiohalocapsa marina]
MNLNELNELDFSNMGEWPLLAKVVLILFLCGALGFGWYYVVIKDQLLRLDAARAQELELRESFEQKQEKAANLNAYRQQLAEMEESFGTMLRQLPDQTEVAALLVDVSQTGLAAGLEFELFQPAGERMMDFYAELPVRMRVNGQFHDFGRFISGLAALPRIVTIHNVRITAPGKASAGAAGQRLTMEASMKTYRYLEDATKKR